MKTGVEVHGERKPAVVFKGRVKTVLVDFADDPDKVIAGDDCTKVGPKDWTEA